MGIENLAIITTHDLPIRHEGDVHNGKVRSAYWLGAADSKALAEIGLGTEGTQKGVMVISDRISAFECTWQSEGGLKGVPGKGASLNAISKYWFDRFEEEGLAGNHILAAPHPLVWIVEKAEPVMIEAIARQYITGSMWRAYEKGERVFCGITLPEGLKKDQRLDTLLITPTTKGIMKGIPGIPEKDDVNLTREQIYQNFRAFGFRSVEDIKTYERLLTEGFGVIDRELDLAGKVFVDTKFEFGYLRGKDGNIRLGYMDEIGTPDSSRYWDKEAYKNGKTIEESKEMFRQKLLDNVPDRDVLLNKERMEERTSLAASYRVPDEVFMDTSALYKGLAETITKTAIPTIGNAKDEILESLAIYGLVR